MATPGKERTVVTCSVFFEMDLRNDNYSLPEDFNGPLIAAALAIQMTGALVANGIVLIATLSQYKSLKLPSTMLFTSLIIMHLVMALLYMPFWIISAASGGWIFGKTTEEKVVTCTIHGCILNYGIWIIFGTLTAISVDRWLFIVKPNFHRRFMKPKVTMTLIVFIWIAALILDTAPFYGFGMVSYGEYGACVPQFEGEIVYVLSNLTLIIIQVCIMIVTSARTYCFTRKFIREHSQLADDVYVSRNRRLVGIFSAMLIGYTICFLPALTVTFLSQIFDLKWQHYISVLMLFFMVNIVNPIIQSYFRPDLKKALIKFHYKVCKHKSFEDTTIKPKRTPNV